MVKELFEIMESLNDELEKLLLISQNKRKAIVNRNLEELENSIKKEEKLLAEIKKLESRRMEILNNLADGKNIKTKNEVDSLMEKIAEGMPEKLSEQLYYLRAKIRETGQRIKSVNQQNMFLIESSREILRLLFSELKGSRESFIVNRKV